MWEDGERVSWVGFEEGRGGVAALRHAHGDLPGIFQQPVKRRE